MSPRTRSAFEAERRARGSGVDRLGVEDSLRSALDAAGLYTPEHAPADSEIRDDDSDRRTVVVDRYDPALDGVASDGYQVTQASIRLSSGHDLFFSWKNNEDDPGGAHRARRPTFACRPLQGGGI
jgi:hypothetical protein